MYLYVHMYVNIVKSVRDRIKRHTAQLPEVVGSVTIYGKGSYTMSCHSWQSFATNICINYCKRPDRC